MQMLPFEAANPASPSKGWRVSLHGVWVQVWPPSRVTSKVKQPFTDPQTPTLRLHPTTPWHPRTQQRWCRGEPIRDASQSPLHVRSMRVKQCQQRTKVLRRRKTRGRRALCCPAPSIVAGSNVFRRLESGRPSRQILHTGCVPQTSRQAFARGMALPIVPIQNPLSRNLCMPRQSSRPTSFFSLCESEKESVGREQFVLHDDLNALISMHFAS